MVFPDQHAWRIGEVIHVHSPDIRVYIGKKVTYDFSAVGIQPRNKIGRLSSTPDVTRLVEYSVVRIDRTRRPFFEFLRFRVENSDLLGAEIIFSEPNLIVWSDILR